jgi:hypothetical protein
MAAMVYAEVFLDCFVDWNLSDRKHKVIKKNINTLEGALV